MSNHVHIDLTDPGIERVREGGRPDGVVVTPVMKDFLCHFKSLMARSGNCLLGRWEHFWAPKSHEVEVETPEAAAAGMVYTMCNPVMAGLVASLKAWPGLGTLPEQLPTRGPVEFGTFRGERGPRGRSPAPPDAPLLTPSLGSNKCMATPSLRG